MQLPVATALLAACLAVAAAQRYTGPNPNNVDEYDYEDAGAQPLRPQPQPRSYAPNQARVSAAASQPKPTPVPILKQINRHNDDGSYTYGYEGADGSFKIETKLVTGEVMGKYGYVDDSGKVRVVEYGANKFGFQPAGEGITVAPPTLVDETRTQKPGRLSGLGPLSAGPSQESQEDIYDDGQYYEEPSTAAPIRASPLRSSGPRVQSALPPRPRVAPTPQYFENSFSAPSSRPSAIPSNLAQLAQFTQSTSFAAPQQPQPQPQARPRYSPASLGPASFGPASFGPSSLGPAPPRAQIAGAVPVGPSPAYRAVTPAPVREHAPAPAAAQPHALFVPQSQLPGLSQHYTQQAAPTQPRRPAPGGGGLLDQLARDYALPQNAAQPLVDTSFGFY